MCRRNGLAGGYQSERLSIESAVLAFATVSSTENLGGRRNGECLLVILHSINRPQAAC